MEKSQNQLWNFNENDNERSLDENDGERNIDKFETDDNLFNDQESKLPNYNEPIFICDYPTSVANEFYKIIGMKASSKVSGVLLFGFNIPDLIEQSILYSFIYWKREI
ncbi:unnamed protein product [Rhizophagus irregularis]|nr:unnamed protein product [Rhizophagus irregularis]